MEGEQNSDDREFDDSASQNIVPVKLKASKMANITTNDMKSSEFNPILDSTAKLNSSRKKYTKTLKRND